MSSQSKNTVSVTFTLDLTCRDFFGYGRCFWDPLRRMGFCINITAVNLVSSPVTMLFKKYLHGWQFLYWHQHDFVSASLSRCGKIWVQHDACPNFQRESHDMGFLKFQLPMLLHKQSNDDWHESLSRLFRCFLHFWMLKVIQNMSSTEVQLSLKRLYRSWVCSTHCFIPNCLFQCFKSLWKCFP